jgi:hypothetical protein
MINIAIFSLVAYPTTVSNQYHQHQCRIGISASAGTAAKIHHAKASIDTNLVRQT